jgi:hypothetical protein
VNKLKKFEAMYYPYASIHNKETLKLSLLYFDKIHILSPEHYYSIGGKPEELDRGNEIYEGLNEEYILKPPLEVHMETKHATDRPKSYQELIRKQIEERRSRLISKSQDESNSDEELKSDKVIISAIDPSEIYIKHYSEFLDSIKEDLNDEKFKKLALGKKWFLFYEKTSPFLDIFENKITYERGRDDFLLVDGDLAESILLNHAIFASMDKKLTPFTDELEHSRLLNHKMQRNYAQLKDRLKECGFIDDVKEHLLSKKVLEVHFSGVQGVNFSDILDFRDDNKNELKSFRIEMGRISTSISSKPWTPEFDSEVAQIIKSEIEPKVQDLENQSSEFKDNMLVKYGKKAIPVAITLGATVYAGVPLSLGVIGYTLLDKLVKGDDNVIESIFNDWKDWRHQNRNSLTYLMNFNKLSS